MQPPLSWSAAEYDAVVMRRSGRDRPIGCELAKTPCDQTAYGASCEENEQILNIYALLEEELTNSGQEHLDASVMTKT